MPSYPAGFTMSNHALVTLSDALRHRRAAVGTRWRRPTVGEQALLAVAHLRKRLTIRNRQQDNAGYPVAGRLFPGVTAGASSRR